MPLMRSRRHKMIAGVCGGIAAYKAADGFLLVASYPVVLFRVLLPLLAGFAWSFL